jgi:dTDP-4-dehydrorhamnose 3,5-epimerase
MHVAPSPVLPDVLIVKPDPFEDRRGFFMELYHREKYQEAGITDEFVQDNRSLSKKGTLRGLHYQLGRPQGKLVWALSGEIFDVVVDIRKRAPTFGRWFGTILSRENGKGLFIPCDFAHGFCVLSEEADIFYKCTEFYSPEHERCIRWDDPRLAIDWPVQKPILSEKDKGAPFFKDAELP